MRGCISKRGRSYRLKIDLDRGLDGKRRVRTITVNGSRKQAEAKLAELLNDQAKGVLPDASKLSVETYLWSWLDGKHVSPVTHESYSKIIAKGICPTLGKIALQRLRPIEIKSWLSTMITKGSRTGGALSTRTVRHFYRVLRAALADAVKLDLLSRNVADAVSPPKLDAAEIEILTTDQIAAALHALKGSRLHPIVSLAVATGARRSELLALRWSDVSGGTLRIERSLEQTKGLAFKCPKTKAGRRSISLPSSAVAMLEAHRKDQLELRMKLGMGKAPAEALVFCNPDGSPISPNYLSIMWWRFIASDPSLPRTSFHSLRHFHASALVAAGLDVVKIAKRLGHSSPVMTLSTYAHLFGDTDDGAAEAIERIML